jgi:hypothetical protein
MDKSINISNNIFWIWKFTEAAATAWRAAQCSAKIDGQQIQTWTGSHMDTNLTAQNSQNLYKLTQMIYINVVILT